MNEEFFEYLCTDGNAIFNTLEEEFGIRYRLSCDSCASSFDEFKECKNHEDCLYGYNGIMIRFYVGFIDIPEWARVQTRAYQMLSLIGSTPPTANFLCIVRTLAKLPQEEVEQTRFYEVCQRVDSEFKR